MLAKKPTDKNPLGERGYIPLFSVQSLYVVELKLLFRTRLARQMHGQSVEKQNLLRAHTKPQVVAL
jgi:hypothetical protein